MLTLQGWLAICGFIIALSLFLVTHIHPFLAVNSPIQADILVVEGWIPDYAVKNAIAEFNKGDYQKLITTGLPLQLGYYLSPYKNAAELAAATLTVIGFDPNKLVAVPASNAARNRTSAAATALNQWLKDSDLNVKSINVYTFDAHARRSWLIFKQALAPNIKVGIIAGKSTDYNPKKWWISSAGVRVHSFRNNCLHLCPFDQLENLKKARLFSTTKKIVHQEQKW
jgi:hypothetical protein